MKPSHKPAKVTRNCWSRFGLFVEEHFRLLTRDETSRVNEGSDAFPQMIAGRYRVISRLGSGSFGDVYRVSDDMAGGAELAVKILRSSDPRALQHFKREFRSLADIYHHNIIRLHELVAAQKTSGY